MKPSLIPPSELIAFPMFLLFLINTATEALIAEVLTFYLAGVCLSLCLTRL